MNLKTIAPEHQADVISAYWTMLRECEIKADNEKDALLKRWVENWYVQWNRVTGDTKKPIWMCR